MHGYYRYFHWLLRVWRVWCSFVRVRFGILYFLVKRNIGWAWQTFFCGV